jgi:hypothetical protein
MSAEGQSETKSKDYYALTLLRHILSKLSPLNGKPSKEQQSVLHAVVIMLAGDAVERNGECHKNDKYKLFSLEAMRYATTALPALLEELGLSLTEQQLLLLKHSDISLSKPFAPNPSTETGWNEYVELRRTFFNVLLVLWKQIAGSDQLGSGKAFIEKWERAEEAMYKHDESK